MMRAFKLMNALRGLRGTWLDPFRNNAERQLDARLLAQYEQDIAELLAAPQARALDTVLVLAALPQKIRGYGHVREASAASADNERAQLLASATPQLAQAA